MIAHYYLCLCLLASFGLSARGNPDGLREVLINNAAPGAGEEPENQNLEEGAPGADEELETRIFTYVKELAKAGDSEGISKFGFKDACGEPLKETLQHTISNISQTMLTNFVKKAIEMYNKNAGAVHGLTCEDVCNFLKTHAKEARPIVILAVLSYATAFAIKHKLYEHKDQIAMWPFMTRFVLYQVLGFPRALTGMFPGTTNVITLGVTDVESLTQDGFGAGNAVFFSTTMPILSVFPLFLLSYYPTMADKFVRLVVSNPMVKLILIVCSFVFHHDTPTKTELMEYVAVGHTMLFSGTIMSLLHFMIYQNLWNQLAFCPLGAAEEGVVAIAKQAMSNPDRFLHPIMALMLCMNLIQTSLVERNWKSAASSFMLISVIFCITFVQKSPIQVLDIFPVLLASQLTYAGATFAEYLYERNRVVEAVEADAFRAMP